MNHKRTAPDENAERIDLPIAGMSCAQLRTAGRTRRWPARQGVQRASVITRAGNIFHAKGLKAPGEYQKARGE